MEYSKIKSIHVENFMGHRNSTVHFDDRGILNFKGYNSAGKSAFLTSVAVALMNMYPQKHTKYIYHGEQYFRIVITFDDGVSILRDKYSNGQSLYEMYRGDECIFTTKAGNKLTRIDGVPTPIENYLGLISTQLGYLNYQVRRDPMWLIDTTGSENYYTLNEVLKSEELARASAMLNSDKNQLQSDLTHIESELSGARMQLDSYSSLNEDLLLKLSEKEIYVQNLLNQYDLIYTLGNLIEELESIQDIPEVEGIDISRLNSVKGLEDKALEVASILFFPEVLEHINDKEMLDILSLQEKVKNVEEAEKHLLKCEISGVDLQPWVSVANVHKAAKEYHNSLVAVKEFKEKENSLIKERDALIKEADAAGMKFVICENCGTLMEVEKG